jgi:hypothetical protein
MCGRNGKPQVRKDRQDVEITLEEPDDSNKGPW